MVWLWVDLGGRRIGAQKKSRAKVGRNELGGAARTTRGVLSSCRCVLVGVWCIVESLDARGGGRGTREGARVQNAIDDAC